jgi:hypothetical protein
MTLSFLECDRANALELCPSACRASRSGITPYRALITSGTVRLWFFADSVRPPNPERAPEEVRLLIGWFEPSYYKRSFKCVSR